MKIKIKGTSVTIQHSLIKIRQMIPVDFDELDEIEIEEIFENQDDFEIKLIENARKSCFSAEPPYPGIGNITC